MSVIRKIIGFIPSVIAACLALIGMSPVPATSEIYRTPLYRPSDVPLYIWLWLIFAIVSGVLLCMKKTMPFGLAVGVIPHIIVTVSALFTDSGTPTAVLGGAMILFYIIYGMCYYVYHREAERE